MIRLFAAVAVPPAIADGLTRRQHGIEDARWQPSGELHITLRFFGEVSESVAEDLDVELSQIRRAPFAPELAGVGHFGEGEEIGAVWAGVAENPALSDLARACEVAARRAGLKPDTRVFHPHVTLAYLRRPNPAQVAAWIQGNNLLRSPRFQVAGFNLYSSWRARDGSRYELERTYRLGALVDSLPRS